MKKANQDALNSASEIFGSENSDKLGVFNKNDIEELTLKHQILELDKENKKLFKYYKAHISMVQENARLRGEIKGDIESLKSQLIDSSYDDKDKAESLARKLLLVGCGD